MRTLALLSVLALGCYRSYELTPSARDGGAPDARTDGATRDAGERDGAPPALDGGPPEPLPPWPAPPPPGTRPSDDPDAGTWRPPPGPGEGDDDPCCTVSEPREVARTRQRINPLRVVWGGGVWHLNWDERLVRDLEERQVLAMQRIDPDGAPVGGTTREPFRPQESGYLAAYGAGRLALASFASDTRSTRSHLWILDETHRVRDRRPLPEDVFATRYVYFPYHRGWVGFGDDRTEDSRLAILLVDEDWNVTRRLLGARVDAVLDFKSRLVVMGNDASTERPCTITVLEGAGLEVVDQRPCPATEDRASFVAQQAVRIRDEVLILGYGDGRVARSIRFDPFQLRFTTEAWIARPELPTPPGPITVEESAGVIGMLSDRRFLLTTFDFERLGGEVALPGEARGDDVLAAAGIGRFAYITVATDAASSAILTARIDTAFAE